MTYGRANILLIEVDEPKYERTSKWLRIRKANVRSVDAIDLPGAEELGQAALKVVRSSVFPTPEAIGKAILERIRGPLPETIRTSATKE